MDTHHIHDEKIGFHHGASDAAQWLKRGMTRDGMKDLLKRAEKGETVHFIDGEGRKFKLEHHEEHGFSVDKRH